MKVKHLNCGEHVNIVQDVLPYATRQCHADPFVLFTCSVGCLIYERIVKCVAIRKKALYLVVMQWTSH